MKATKRLLQDEVGLSRKQAVMFHKEHGTDYEGDLQNIKVLAGVVKTTHLEAQKKHKKDKKKQ